MNQVDALVDGFNAQPPRFDLCIETDETGNQTYGIRYNTSADRYFERAIDTYGTDQSVVEKDYLTDEFSLTVGPGAIFPGEWPSGEPFPDMFNFTPNALKGLDTAVKDLGVGVDGPETSNDTPDYDAELAEGDLDLVMARSPMEQFEAMQSAAIDAWRGKLGNGADRREALQQMGFSDEECQRIQAMVDRGPEWCVTATPEAYDAEFRSPDGKTLAERDAEFRVAQAEAASRLMTYEGAEDLMARYNADVGEDGVGITEDQAAAVYDRAAHVLDEAYASGNTPTDTPTEELEESMGNLADYISANPDAEFQGGVDEATGDVMWVHEQDPVYEEPENGGPEFGD